MAIPTFTKVAQDPLVPRRCCVVIVDGEVVYAGRISKLVIPFTQLEGVLWVLSPEDFADGEAFFKAQTQPN